MKKIVLVLALCCLSACTWQEFTESVSQGAEEEKSLEVKSPVYRMAKKAADNAIPLGGSILGLITAGGLAIFAKKRKAKKA